MSLETSDKIRTLQRKLYRKAKAEPAFRFYILYDKICRQDILRQAYALARSKAGVDLHRKRYCWRTGADFQSACGGRNRAPYDRPWRGAADVNVVVPTPMANMVHGLLRT
jgi:hypothetical protein